MLQANLWLENFAFRAVFELQTKIVPTIIYIYNALKSRWRTTQLFFHGEMLRVLGYSFAHPSRKFKYGSLDLKESWIWESKGLLIHAWIDRGLQGWGAGQSSSEFGSVSEFRHMFFMQEEVGNYIFMGSAPIYNFVWGSRKQQSM